MTPPTGTETTDRNAPDILIIDDDIAMRELLSLHLEFAGYRVRTAEDGLEGGKALLNGPRPDLVLMDMRMPHMGGDQLLELLRAEEQFKDLKIIALSSIRNDGFVMKVTDLGVAEFLHKPVDKDLLLATVKKVLAK